MFCTDSLTCEVECRSMVYSVILIKKYEVVWLKCLKFTHRSKKITITARQPFLLVLLVISFNVSISGLAITSLLNPTHEDILESPPPLWSRISLKYKKSANYNQPVIQKYIMKYKLKRVGSDISKNTVVSCWDAGPLPTDISLGKSSTLKCYFHYNSQTHSAASCTAHRPCAFTPTLHRSRRGNCPVTEVNKWKRVNKETQSPRSSVCWRRGQTAHCPSKDLIDFAWGCSRNALWVPYRITLCKMDANTPSNDIAFVVQPGKTHGYVKKTSVIPRRPQCVYYISPSCLYGDSISDTHVHIGGCMCVCTICPHHVFMGTRFQTHSHTQVDVYVGTIFPCHVFMGTWFQTHTHIHIGGCMCVYYLSPSCLYGDSISDTHTYT